MPAFIKDRTSFFIILLICIGAVLRVYNLNWGAPYYFHPDERNIASLLASNTFTADVFFKSTFSYGNFPVLVLLFLKPLYTPLFMFLSPDPFAHATMILRLLSATLSVLLLVVIYHIGKLFSKTVGLIALFLATFSVGFIHQAHFGTFDGFITFWVTLSCYLLLRFVKEKHIRFYYYAISALVIAASAKFNVLVLMPLLLLGLLIVYKPSKKHLKPLIINGLIGCIIAAGATPLLSPYYTTADFLSLVTYERGVVTGTLPVFYTQSFLGTIPIVYQLTSILPFLVNPIITIAFIVSFIYLIIKLSKTKNSNLFFIIAFLLFLFLPQSFLHTKWTRYMIPVLPFLYLIVSIATVDLFQYLSKNYKVKSIVRTVSFSIVGAICILFGMSYFLTAFTPQDTRVVAAEWAERNIPHNAVILSETYDPGSSAFSNFPNMTFFNFYDLETNNYIDEGKHLPTLLQESDYIILPSQRVIQSRMGNPTDFPKGNSFYQSLLNGSSGYTKIYETPCNLFCKITYLNDPVFRFEQTSSVFERPTVFIFKKR